jgi:hypothetical protein
MQPLGRTVEGVEQRNGFDVNRKTGMQRATINGTQMCNPVVRWKPRQRRNVTDREQLSQTDQIHAGTVDYSN